MLFKQLHYLLLATFLFTPLALFAADNTDESQAKTKATRLAVVSVSTLMDESPRAKVMGEEIKRKYLPQEQLLAVEHEALKQLEELLDKSSNNSPTNNAERIQESRDIRQRKRKYTRDYETFRDDLNTARQEALNTVRSEVLEAIDTVRKIQNIDIIIENYISASDAVDITKDVINYLTKQYQAEQRVLTLTPKALKEEE